jgi:hypothetical protein
MYPTTYRACIWTSADKQSEVVLTLPEDVTEDEVTVGDQILVVAARTDAQLLKLGRESLAHAGLLDAGGSLAVAEWTEV